MNINEIDIFISNKDCSPVSIKRLGEKSWLKFETESAGLFFLDKTLDEVLKATNCITLEEYRKRVNEKCKSM